MITVRLYTGQVLTFPDGTSEEAIRRASQEVLSGEADRKRGSVVGGAGKGASFDLSGLRRSQAELQPPPPVDDPRARTEARLRGALPASPDNRELPDRSPEWWQSVSGSSSSKAEEWADERDIRLRLEARQRDYPDTERALGLIDRGAYFEDEATGQRHRKTDLNNVRDSWYGGDEPTRLDEPLDPQYRPLSNREQRLRDLGAPYRQPDSPENLELGRAVVGGIPGRVAASEAGLLLPIQAAEAVAKGVRGQFEDPLSPDTGEAFVRGAKRGWAESPITQGAEIINREIVEPDREWLARAATAAGVSPRASAALDTAQMVAGEALNPGNYIGLDMLRGVSAAERAGTSAARTASLEARGGARSISTGEGLVPREYGTGIAGSELAQMRRNRTYGRPERGPFMRVVDTVRETAGVPWTVHGGYSPAVPIVERPKTPEPFPRDIAREPVQVAITGSRDPALRQDVLLAWDYVSRRHPRLASTVDRISIVENRKGFGQMSGPTLYVSPDLAKNPDVLLHELTHRAQELRRGRMSEGDFGMFPTAEDIAEATSRKAERESTAIRRSDVYRGTGPSASTSMVDPMSLSDDDLWQSFDAARRDAVGAQSTLERARSISQMNAFDREIIERGKNAGPEFWGIGDQYGGLSVPDELQVARRKRPARSAMPEDYPSPIDDAGGAGPVAPSESWLDRVSGLIRQVDERDVAQRMRLNAERDPATLRLRTQFEAQSETLPSGDIVNSRTFDMDAPGSGMRTPLPEERGVIPGQGTVPTASPEVPPHGLRYPEGKPVDESAFHVRTNDEITAERMGWKDPTNGGVGPRPTRVASSQASDPAFRGSIDPITTPEGQTNFAAQIDPMHGYFGDPDVAGEVIEKSDKIFREKGAPQSWDTLEQMAANSGYTVDEMRNMKWDVLPPAVRLRMGMIFEGNKDELLSLHGKIADGTASDVDKIKALRLIKEQGDIIRMGARSGSEYGRALNSNKMEIRRSLSPDQVVRQKLYREYANEIDANRDILDALARLDPNNPDELATFQRLVDRPKFREYLQEYWIASVLSGPATHERNAIGNTVNAIMENAVVRPLSAGFDWARTARTGAEREIFLRETPEALIGLTRGIRQGVRRGLEVLKRGYPTNTHGAPSGKLMPVRSAFARSQNRVVREVVGPIVTMPLRLLSASDELFKAMNHTAELYAQAAKAAKKAGLSGRGLTDEIARLVQNPTQEMVDAADSFALKATFNDETSAIGKAIMNLRDLPREGSGWEAYRAGAGFIIPFVRIADRLMVRGFEYTPVGAVKSAIARKSGNLVESADLAARSAIGSVIMAYAASLAYEGRLTAGAPTDERERAAFYDANKQPWSVRTEDGLWIPYGGLQPVGTPFALAAAAWKGWAEHGEAPNDEKLGHAAAMVGQYATDQSFMEGLSNFMEAVEGGEGAGRAFSRVTTGIAQGTVPYSGLLRSISQAIDPRVIDAKTFGEKMKRNIPGISRDMRAKLTPWGEEVVPTGGRWRSVLAPGSILLPSQEKENPLDEELQRLGMPLGPVGKSIADKLPKRSALPGARNTDWLDRELDRLGMPLGYTDKTVSGMYGNGKSRGTWKLDDDEWHMYQQTAGRATRKVLERLFARADYAGWDFDRQRDEVERAIGAAREYAKMWAVRYHRANRPRTIAEVD